MTKDEALTLALEALENHCGNYKLDDAGVKRYIAACKAIEEALAQPEQDGECKYCTYGCVACDARYLPEQEPVGFAVMERPWGETLGFLDKGRNR